MPTRMNRAASAAIALSLGLALSACNTAVPKNRSLYSVKQPVVERANYTLDLAATDAGLSIPEQGRLADWFSSMDLRYGDRIAVEDGTASAAVREDVAAIAGRYGLLISDGAPVTEGYVNPVNGNMAAMIADPEHLLRGAAGTGETVVMSSTKAIKTYR